MGKEPMISAQEIFEVEKLTETQEALIPTLRDNYSIAAKIKREKFIALKKEGFTDEQAMQIVISRKSKLDL